MNHVNICIFCGAWNGNSPVYSSAAQELARVICRRGCGIVYGGGNIGLMGVVADTALNLGGRVIGVIPEIMVEWELAHHGVTELRVVKTMHERKALMIELSHAFIAMPGGLGTLDELCEVLTLNQLRFVQKPCGILNVNGYYDPLIEQLKKAEQEGFIKDSRKPTYFVESDAETLVGKIVNSIAV
jgi:uncharacterized protein (TIGR00730 family)